MIRHAHAHTRRGLSTTQIVLICVGGVLVAGCVVSALLTALLLPALGKARFKAKGLKSRAQIQLVIQSRSLYQLSNEGSDVQPPTLQVLQDENYIDPALLDSPFGPVADGRGDYWFRVTAVTEEDVDDPGHFVLMYDRAMYAEGEEVAVGYLDHTDAIIPTYELDMLIMMDPNREADFDLPAPRN